MIEIIVVCKVFGLSVHYFLKEIMVANGLWFLTLAGSR